MKLSVIIPTLNEARNIGQLIDLLQEDLSGRESEIIVVDGGSNDNTVELAAELGAKVVACEKMNRAYQMNRGGEMAKYDVLYFVHADSMPPSSFYNDINQAIEEGYDLGCFRFRFDSDKALLAVNSYCTRFDRMMCRGGDQTLFVKREVFEALKGYKSDYRIMEDYDFIKRARKRFRFKIIPKAVVVSARKYINNSYLRVNFANLIVFILYKLGASQERMLKTYDRLIHHPKAEALK